MRKIELIRKPRCEGAKVLYVGQSQAFLPRFLRKLSAKKKK
jgi:hypothetical protein